MRSLKDFSFKKNASILESKNWKLYFSINERVTFLCFFFYVAYPKNYQRSIRADSRFAPSQWETSLQSNAFYYWLVAKLESDLRMNIQLQFAVIWFRCGLILPMFFRVSSLVPGSAFIKPDQLDPWIKDHIKITLLPTISHLQLPNFVSCGRACPSHMTQNLVTVGAKLCTAERFPVDPWSMDYADPVW